MNIENAFPIDSEEPVVVRGGASTWAASKWDFKALAARGGDALVPVTPTKYKNINGTLKRDGATKQMPIREFMEAIDAGFPAGHINGSDLLNVVPGLREDLGFPDVGAIHFDTMWVGPTGNTTPIHFDRMPNVFAQLHGQKRWRLWHPKNKFPLAGWSGPGYRFANIDLDEAGTPDLDVTLEAGDLLMFPTSWWHHVYTVSSSISVNRWWALPAFGRVIGHVLPKAAFRRTFEAIRDAQMRLIAG